MSKPVIVTRLNKGTALDYDELDTNFTNLRDATITVTGDSGPAQVLDLNSTVNILGGAALTSVMSTDTVTVNLDNTTVTPGSYTNVDLTVDAQGRITAAQSGPAVSSVNSFGEVVVGGSNIFANQPAASLVLAAGAGISLSGNSLTRQVIITNSSPNTNQLVFNTIAVPGQGNVVADAISDTLTLAAGTGMSITTNASTDTITFNSTASGGTGFPAETELVNLTASTSNITFRPTDSTKAYHIIVNAGVNTTLTIELDDLDPQNQYHFIVERLTSDFTLASRFSYDGFSFFPIASSNANVAQLRMFLSPENPGQHLSRIYFENRWSNDFFRRNVI